MQADDGSARHLPSGRILAALTERPGNPSGQWTTYRKFVFPEPATLSKGRIYHIVFSNASSAPGANYISVNELFTFEPQRHPGLSPVYAVLYASGGGWELLDRNTADMDPHLRQWPARRAGVHRKHVSALRRRLWLEPLGRERFTVSSADRTVQRVWVRVKRAYGPSPLKVRLERADGTVISAASVTADRVPTSASGCTRGGAVWVSATFASPVSLAKGSTYETSTLRPRPAPATPRPHPRGSRYGSSLLPLHGRARAAHRGQQKPAGEPLPMETGGPAVLPPVTRRSTGLARRT